MHRFPYFLLVFAGCAALYSCATIIHGTTQDVTVIAPQGTQIADTFGNDPAAFYSHSGNITLHLKRNKDYSFRFLYKGQEVRTNISSTLEPGWIVADFFTDLIGYVVDGITGAWNSFDDPIVIHFPSDTSHQVTYTEPIAEIADAYPSPKIGIIATGKLGLVFPAESALGGSYGIGIGYEAYPRLSFLLAYEGGNGIDILPQYSNYYTSGAYSHIDLECRFKAGGSLYLTGGGGLSNITSDSLQLDRYTYDENLQQVIESPIHTAPADKWMPTLFVGIGIAGPVGYLELRHTFGLSSIAFSNGETWHFAITSISFGVNLRF